MKRFALAGAGFAALVAIACALYLKKSHDAVQRVVKPVALSAPDLFPATTLLYAEMTGWEKSHARADEAWKRFETTATWSAIRRGWEKHKLGLDEDIVGFIEKTDQQFDRATEKFGYRPTSREFFENFGKHVAVGLLPSPKGELPRFLFATRLPDEGPKALQAHLSKAGGVKPCDPALHKGFPVFQEIHEGPDLTVYYGVGRGYLFISNALPEMKAALERLALATDGDAPEKPKGTLAEDAVLARVRPPAGKPETGVFYLRREQSLAQWRDTLAPVDDFIKNAFVLAPKDPAVAFGLPDGPDGEIRCSFQSSSPKPWTKSLPPGLAYLVATVPTPPEKLRALRAAESEAFFGKPFWKEIDAFLSDPKRVRDFVEEALPEEDRPEVEITSRLQNDARVFGSWARSWIESAANLPTPDVFAASKVYPGPNGTETGQGAMGIDLDPFSVFLVAGGLDLLRTHWPDWVTRTEGAGVLSWSLNMRKFLNFLEQEAPPEMYDLLEPVLAPLAPSILIVGDRVVLVFGADFAKEIAALHAGSGPTFDDDPLFAEARAKVAPGYSMITWDRPWDRLRTGFAAAGSLLDQALARTGSKEEHADFAKAGLKTLERMVGWAKPTRAILTAAYDDAARIHESVELVDADAEKGVPAMVPGDAAPRSLDLLPTNTYLYRMTRLQTKPTLDAIKAAFVEALPGGEERLKTLLPKDELIDALADGIVANLKGEAGFAIAKPTPEGTEEEELEEGPGFQYFINRWPQVVAFAEFERPVDAFQAVRKGLERIYKAANTPRHWKEILEERSSEFDPLPLGVDFKVGQVGTYRAAALDVYIPQGLQYGVISLFVVERDGYLFLTNSGKFAIWLGEAKLGDAGSLSARLAKELPAGTIPATLSSLGLFHDDTLIDAYRTDFELLAKIGPQLTLRGYEERPPADRIEAHAEGWKRWINLALDLFTTNAWTVGHTSRTNNVVRSSKSVVPETGK
jgi:hypothetical protein